MDAFVTAAEKCHAGGHPIGVGLGATSDSVDAVGAFFSSFGAVLVNEAGDITADTDQVRQVLEYMKRLGKVLPKDVAAWDDASNNKFLVSGNASMIMNPDRKSVVEGKSVSVRVDLGGRRINKNKNIYHITSTHIHTNNRAIVHHNTTH